MTREAREGSAFLGIATGCILGSGFWAGCWALGHALGWW